MVASKEEILEQIKPGKVITAKLLTDITNLAANTQIPGLYVAYADNIKGSGFSKTDSSKLYKGYGVKNSNVATDYRWERNVDNLQIGGRNLLKDTANFGNSGMPSGAKDGWLETSNATLESEKYNGLTVRSLKNVASTKTMCDYCFTGFNLGDTYTLSFWAKGTIDRFRCYFYGDSGFVGAKVVNASIPYSSTGGFGDGKCSFDNPQITNWTRISITWQLNSTGDINVAKRVLFRTDEATGGDLYVCGVKFEKGNKATDWSPAPEDQVSQVELDEIKSYIGYTDTDIYGVEIDMTNRRFTRLSGAIGKNGGADFDNINAYKRKRCILTNDGVVLAYHGEENYTESGATTVEIVKNGATYPIGTPVQVMVEQPKFYYKVVPLVLEPIANGKGYHMRKGRYYISDYPKAGFKVHPAFVRNGVEHEKIYLSAYEGSIYDKSASAYLLNDEQVADFSADLLSSIANAKPCSGLRQDLKRSNARLLANNRGNGWEQQTVQTVSLTQLLFLIEYAKFNMQDVLGMGATQKRDDGSSNLAEKTGSTTSLGNASGAVTNSNSIQIVAYRGEENPYGNIWKFVDGINVMANGIHAVYVADHDFSDKQSTGSYTDVGFTLAKTSGYVSAFGYSQEFDWLFLISETTGNSSVPVGDYFWQNYTATDDGGWRTVLLGASWGDGSYAGGFCWNVNHSSVCRGRNLSGRLVYVGG